ncbi:hypothetical protein BS50DRAFT_550262 [Corynespora cassiicola Philippines]|uniref:Uncharacterized protein n=1 Tax=Corynespora cassiicola Philippines TaxID=1448308 RepID=A0A2T2NVF2_CORCC|nr:hypothetical protein BS50DRAFT_550262 [Corynespora cassiicola Philippines]
MSPAPITQETGASPAASPPQPIRPIPVSGNFDDIFHAKFMTIIQRFRDDPRSGQLTQKDRKSFIDTAYYETDEIVFGNRQLTDNEIKLRALTKVFYKVLAEEPWSEEWIRPHDVERKLSRFEMHKDSVELAARYGLTNPREAIKAARYALLESKSAPKDKPGNRGPFDDIEIIYIPGTVSSTATNKIDRDQIYPVSVSSVANILQHHICRDMTRPYAMAEKFVTCTDTEELMKLRQFACDICDFAPHLLDNDNISLLIVLLILTRSEICRRFENNGIRIEGSTISHRRAECMKQKLGWKSTDERKPFDNVAIEFQTRVKNACFPAPRAHRVSTRKPSRKSSTPATPATPPIGYYSSPQVRLTGSANGNVNTGINIAAPPPPAAFYAPPPSQPHGPASTPGHASEPMDLS